MSNSNVSDSSASSPRAGVDVPLPVLVVFRGIGQVFFQENALTGALFALGIALCIPLQAAGLIAGAIIGTATAWVLKFNEGELKAGIYGFNSTLVGIATLFFFEPGTASLTLLVVGSAAAALITRAARGSLPFPTYTGPFIVTTWAVFFVANAMGAVRVTDYPALVPNPTLPFSVEATAHGVGQVMFQGSLWTGILFLVGIAISDRCHAGWVLAGSIVGMLVAVYHFTLGANSIDPERLIPRTAGDAIKLGLYGYNATLAPVALYLWRKSLIAPVLGMLLTVPLTELFPLLGPPALTAPFVVATWVVLALYWLEEKYLGGRAPSPA